VRLVIRAHVYATSVWDELGLYFGLYLHLGFFLCFFKKNNNASFYSQSLTYYFHLILA
jgi:hypothetical protein